METSTSNSTSNNSGAVRIKRTGGGTVNNDLPHSQLKYLLICHNHHVCVTVTSQPLVVDDWICTTINMNKTHLENGNRLIVGLGATWTRRSGGTTTIQLCQGHRCLVFQIRYTSHFPRDLSTLLSDTRIIFVVACNTDAAKDFLFNSRDRQIKVERLLDLRLPTNLYRHCSLDASIEKLASDILGWDEKELAIAMDSDWDNKLLSEEQVKNVALDAFLSCLIGKELRVWKYVETHDF